MCTYIQHFAITADTPLTNTGVRLLEQSFRLCGSHTHIRCTLGVSASDHRPYCYRNTRNTARNAHLCCAKTLTTKLRLVFYAFPMMFERECRVDTSHMQNSTYIHSIHPQPGAPSSAAHFSSITMHTARSPRRQTDCNRFQTFLRTHKHTESTHTHR